MAKDNHQPSGKEKKSGMGQPVAGRPSYLRGRSKIQETVKKDESQNEGRVPVEEVEEVEQEDTELYSWRIWLYPRKPALSAFVTVTMIGILVLGYIMFPSVIFIVLGTLLLLNRLSQYLFPMKYLLTEKTVGYRSLFARDKREWNKFFTYKEFPDGVLLANDKSSIRGKFKADMFLYWEAQKANRDEIMEIVSNKLLPPAEAMDQKSKQFQGGVSSAIRRVRKLKKDDQDNNAE